MTERRLASGTRTQADGLRDDLTQCELLVSRIGSGTRTKGLDGSADTGPVDAKTDGLTLLQLLDAVAAEMEQLEKRGTDLRAERVRFDNVLNQLSSKDAKFASIMGTTLKTERPEDADWWWHLDETVAARRRSRARRALAFGLIGLVAVAVLYVLYDRVLAPPPNVRDAVSAVFQGEKIATEGDYRGAIDQFEKAVELDPDNVNAYLWLGVLYQYVDDPENAAVVFDRARSKIASEVDFLLQRGLVYLITNEWDAAREDAETAIELAPERPEGYFLLGSVAEELGDLRLAFDSFEQASLLAEEAGKPALQVTARMRMATLLELMMVPQE